MITTLVPTLWSLTDLVRRSRAAYVDLNNTAGETGMSSSGAIERVPVSSDYGTSSPTALIVIGLVVLAICVYTLYVIKRDGYGSLPTRDDYDTRRPLP